MADPSQQQKTSIIKKIEVAEIKDGLIVMKDGSLKGVIMTSSLNFALKSTDEQDAITYRYQEFLNSLDFPLQILIITRKFDVSGYLTLLEQKRNEQDNELLKIQVTEYIEFIKGLSQLVNIMSTFFYLVVPFARSEEKKPGDIAGRISAIFKTKNKQEALRSYEEMRLGILQRMEYISAGLSSVGLKSANLSNEELLELLYRVYNPEAKEKPKIEPQISIEASGSDLPLK